MRFIKLTLDASSPLLSIVHCLPLVMRPDDDMIMMITTTLKCCRRTDNRMRIVNEKNESESFAAD